MCATKIILCVAPVRPQTQDANDIGSPHHVDAEPRDQMPSAAFTSFTERYRWPDAETKYLSGRGGFVQTDHPLGNFTASQDDGTYPAAFIAAAAVHTFFGCLPSSSFAAAGRFIEAAGFLKTRLSFRVSARCFPICAVIASTSSSSGAGTGDRGAGGASAASGASMASAAPRPKCTPRSPETGAASRPSGKRLRSPPVSAAPPAPPAPPTNVRSNSSGEGERLGCAWSVRPFGPTICWHICVSVAINGMKADMGFCDASASPL